MAYPFDQNQYPPNAKPKRAYATLADWENWVNRLTRYELDQLYPGMLKNVIATYEMVQAEEEQKVAQHGPFVQNREPNFDKSFNDPAVHPGLVSSDFGSSGQNKSGFGTSSFGDTESSGFGSSAFGSKPAAPSPPSAIKPFEFGGATAKLAASFASGFGTKLAPAPEPTPVPAYTPYTPPVMQPTLPPVLPPVVPQAPYQPFQFGTSASASLPPLPTTSLFPPISPPPAVPGPAIPSPLFGPPAFPPAPKLPHWSGPAMPFAAPKTPQQALPPFTGLPPLPAPMPLPLPAPLGGTARIPSPPGWRPMGLLDMNYVREPKAKGPNRAVQRNAGAITAAPGELPDASSSGEPPASQNAEYGFFSDSWDWLTEGVGEVIKFTAEGRRYVSEFATALMEAPREDQLEFLLDFLSFLTGLIGPVDALRILKDMIRDPAERTLYNVGALILGLLPAVRVVKAGPKLYRFINQGSKKLKAAKGSRGARNGKRPADVPDKPAPDAQMKASGGKDRPRNGEKNKDGLFDIPPRYREILTGAVSGFVVEAVIQTQLEKPNYWLAVVQGASGGATGFVSSIDESEGSQQARKWGLESINTVISQLLRLELTNERVTLDDLLGGIGKERIVALIEDVVSLGFKMGIEEISRRQTWDRTLTNGLKQLGLALIKGVVQGIAFEHFGIGEEPDLVNIMNDMVN